MVVALEAAADKDGWKQQQCVGVECDGGRGGLVLVRVYRTFTWNHCWLAASSASVTTGANVTIGNKKVAQHSSYVHYCVFCCWHSSAMTQTHNVSTQQQ